MLASCRAFHGGVFSWLSAHATQVMYMLVRIFYVGDSIARGFSKKSQIITGNRASFEYFWLSLILCSVLISFFMLTIDRAFIHINIKLFDQNSDFFIQL